jgi:molybdenum cofactor guanylyltransferase
MRRRRRPIGVILAGGSGRRIGGSKAVVQLQGKPLISYPLEALREALGEVAIVSKADTQLPSVSGVTVWIEPDEPRHPLVGIMQSLAFAERRPVVVCAVDLPFVTAELIRALAVADPGKAPAVIAAAHSQTQPLLGCYQPSALEAWSHSGVTPDMPLRDCVAAIRPALFEVSDPELLFNVDAPDDLLQASAMLDARRARAPAASDQPNVKS